MNSPKYTARNLLRVISRESPLALKQTEEFLSDYPELCYKLTSVKSYGDKNKHISLLKDVSPDFFTRELDRMLLNGSADIAIHSAKDLPYPLPNGISIVALTASKDSSDSLVSRGNTLLADLPRGSRVGTSSVARRRELLNLRPDLEVVGIRGTIGERIALVDSGETDAIVVATCALKRLGLQERIAQRLPFETHPLQGMLAVTARSADWELKGLFGSNDIRKTYGRVTLVGFGPGDPGLLTIAGDRELAAADVIFYDDLIDNTALDKYRAEKIYVGKRKDAHSHTQERINELLYRAAIAGKKVVRLKGGDPMVFAHGREEIAYLQSRLVDVAVIPGVSSGIALASCTGIPLTHRGVASSVAFVTGHSADKLQAPDADTLVYYMGAGHTREIARRLIEKGWNNTTPAALVYNVSMPDQKTFFSTLEEMARSTESYPTPLIILVGNVVNLGKGSDTPRKILVTGTNAEEYRHIGQITHTPLIRIERIEDNTQLRSAIEDLNTYNWIIFTSRYGVRYFFEELDKMKKDIRSLAQIKIASVGPVTTNELARRGLYPDMESATESAEGIVSCFEQQRITGNKILLPRSDKGVPELARQLIGLGNTVSDIPVYNNTANPAATRIDPQDYDVIVFSSPSGVDAFKEIYGFIPSDKVIIAKGKTTENRLNSEI